MAMGLALAQRGRPVRFLGKKEVFDVPVVGQMVKAFGGIRVDRGTGSDEPLLEAADALRAGEVVALDAARARSRAARRSSIPN